MTAPQHETGALLAEPGERVLWVYDLKCRWSIPDPQGPEACTLCGSRSMMQRPEPCYLHRDPPPGRMWDSSISTRYLTREATPEDIAQWSDAETFMKSLRTPRPDWADFSATVTLKLRETWALTWFEHAQPDWGEPDHEVLASFSRYVDRIERYNRAHLVRGEMEGYMDPICLMGAEDRWRWHGASPDGKPETRSEPPCRCEGCRKHNVVRISH